METKNIRKNKQKFYIVEGEGEEDGGHIFVGFINPPRKFEKGKYVDEIALEVRASNRKVSHRLDMTKDEAKRTASYLLKVANMKFSDVLKLENRNARSIRQSSGGLDE